MNPLLNIKDLPEFTKINAEHIEPALDELLANNRALCKELLEENRNTPGKT